MKELTDAVRQNMLHLLKKAEAGLAALPPYDFRNTKPHDDAVEALVRELKASGALIDAHRAWEGSRMQFGGVKSTCTAGTAGVIRNWCVSVRKRLGMSEAAA